MQELLNFGKYNFYIWTSYFITFSGMIFIWFRTYYLYKKIRNKITILKNRKNWSNIDGARKKGGKILEI